jgi:hypothetical protein
MQKFKVTVIYGERVFREDIIFSENFPNPSTAGYYNWIVIINNVRLLYYYPINHTIIEQMYNEE